MNDTPPRVDGFTWATRVVVPLVVAGLAFYAHQRLTAVNQLSVLYTIIKDLNGEDPGEALIYLNLAEKLGQIDAQSAQQIKSMLLTQTEAKTDQDFDSDDPSAQSSAMAALSILQSTNASTYKQFARRRLLVIVGSPLTSRDDAEKLRQEVLAKGYAGAQIYLSPKQQYAVALGEFPVPQAIATKNKFEDGPRIDPSVDNAAHLRRARFGWQLVTEGSPPVASGAVQRGGGASSSGPAVASRRPLLHPAAFRVPRKGRRARAARAKASSAR